MGDVERMLFVAALVTWSLRGIWESESLFSVKFVDAEGLLEINSLNSARL